MASCSGMSATNDDLYKINGLGGETFVAATGKAGIVDLACDAAGNVWAAASNTLWEFSSTGTLLVTLTGTFTPGDMEFIGSTLYMTQGNVLDTVVAAGGTATITRVNVTNTGFPALLSDWLTFPAPCSGSQPHRSIP